MATFATDVFKSVAICAKPGKYISIENGPKAVKEPKININCKYLDLDMNRILIFCKGR